METTTNTQTIPQQLDELAQRLDSLNVNMPMRMIVQSHITEAGALLADAKFHLRRAADRNKEAAEMMEQGYNVEMYLNDAARYSKQAADSFSQCNNEASAAKRFLQALETGLG